MIAVTGGILTKMSFGMFILFLVFATIAAFVHELIVGIAAMHSSWFPAFAVDLRTKTSNGCAVCYGLLILSPLAGWAVIVGILIRAIVIKVKGKEAETPMSIMAAGFIAGAALYSFSSSIIKLKK